MNDNLLKLAPTKYRPGLIDLIWVAFMAYGLLMGLADQPKSFFYGLAFGLIIALLRRWGINRPLILWLAAMSVFQLVGEAAGWYQFVPNFDKVVHTLFPIIGSLVAYAVLVRFGLLPRPTSFNDRHPRFTLALTVFLLAVAGGALWEIIEFSGDQSHLFSGPIQLGNFDTMTDIIATFVGGVISGPLAIRIWYKHKEPSTRRL
jgi:hypothetical protein